VRLSSPLTSGLWESLKGSEETTTRTYPSKQVGDTALLKRRIDLSTEFSFVHGAFAKQAYGTGCMHSSSSR